jgi:hypothetical protein
VAKTKGDKGFRFSPNILQALRGYNVVVLQLARVSATREDALCSCWRVLSTRLAGSALAEQHCGDGGSDSDVMSGPSSKTPGSF